MARRYSSSGKTPYSASTGNQMDSLKSAALGSWKTTLVGWLGFIGALVASLQAALDGNAETVPQWGVVVASLTAAVGLTMARDNDKSSEDTGAK